MKEIVNDWMAGGLGDKKGGEEEQGGGGGGGVEGGGGGGGIKRWGSRSRRNTEVGEAEEEGWGCEGLATPGLAKRRGSHEVINVRAMAPRL